MDAAESQASHMMVTEAVTTSSRSNRVERLAGISLFLVVTSCWVFGLAAWEQGWIEWGSLAFWIGAGLSALSVVFTGYLGRIRDALWLGWIPGAAMVAAGIAMTPTPGGDETGGSSIFFGGLVLVLGWPLYFLPLVAAGAYLRGRRRQAAPT